MNLNIKSNKKVYKYNKFFIFLILIKQYIFLQKIVNIQSPFFYIMLYFYLKIRLYGYFFIF